MRITCGFHKKSVLLASAATAILLCAAIHAASAAESICAVVRIEIRQELTLERQAFDAHMKINNGLTHLPLEDVGVEVTFEDEAGNPILASSDPNNREAAFFIRPDSEGITPNNNESWAVEPIAPDSARDLHWLIIPAPGSAQGQKEGKIYYVGAKLTYTLGGESHTTSVSPDYIFVKPLPRIVLDYFLTQSVYGDDAWTPAIEPPEPFTLGVRVKNTGNNTARDLKIDSAQPEIVENEQGLLIGFAIEGSRVNGEPAESSLLVEFGDIEPNSAAVGRWIMTCTLSGEFTEFDATISHSDELGGELTSLIRQENIHTHFLVKDVWVDLPGRDRIHDFLARDAGALKVYESGMTDSDVADQSEDSHIELLDRSGSRFTYTAATAEKPGFIYFKYPDPHNGSKVLSEVIRSDGKQIDAANAWLSKERKENPENGWHYFVNLFDVRTTGAYTLVFDDPAEGNSAPVLQFIPDKTLAEGEPIFFLVEATDPDGTKPVISISGLPAAAAFNDNGDGSAIFDWTPAEGQAGTYNLTFSASDGVLTDRQDMRITVHPHSDTDSDGMKDDWEQRYFSSLERDGTGDYDGDGITDLDEFLLGTDPTRPDHAPSVPVITAPADNTGVNVQSPALTIENSRDIDGDPIFYDYEIYCDPAYSQPVERAEQVPAGQENTTWQTSAVLKENTWYYWRVRATDQRAYSLWRYGRFFVNTQNEPPDAPRISRPADATEADSLRPELEITNSTDPDADAITYTFEIYTDQSMTTPVAEASGINRQDGPATRWQPETALTDGATYYWRVTAVDKHGATAGTQSTSFVVNTLNQAPEAPEIASPGKDAEINTRTVELVLTNSADPDGTPLSYLFEVDRTSTFNSSELIQSAEIPEELTTTSWTVPDLSDNTLYYWRARASDGMADSAWTYGSFFVNTQNHPPALPVVKNPGSKAWVGVLAPELGMHNAMDEDADDIVYTFEVAQNPDFTDPVVRKETAAPRFIPDAEFNDNTRYYWRVLATDAHGASEGWSDTASFFVHKSNHAPDISGVPETSVDQDARYSFIPTAEDPDPGDTISFSIRNKPAWAFFDPETGELHGTPGNSDIGTTSQIVITAADSFGETASLEPFDLTVINVNDPPHISGTPETSVKENTAYSFTPTAGDIDPGDTLTFSIVNKPAWASFDPETGCLTGTPTNEDVGTTAGIAISVTDAAGAGAYLGPFDLVVSNANEAPRAVNDAYTLAEDSPLVLDAPGVMENDIDADAGDSLFASLVKPAEHGSLTLNADGSFIYIPDGNYFGEDAFSYTVSDGQAESDTATAALTITPVNDIPEISGPGDLIMTENTAVTDVSFTVADVENEAGDLVVDAVSDNPALIPEEGLLTGGSGGVRSITLIPAENRHGTAAITVTATDPQGKEAFERFTVTVAPRTEPPRVRYFLLNPDLLAADLYITSLEPDNHITAGTASLDLNQYETGSFPTADLVQGAIISGTGHFAVSSSALETGMPAPEAFSGRTFVIPHVRGDHTYYIYSPYGSASVTIDLGTRIENRVIPEGQVEIFATGGDNTIASKITASLPVIISHAAHGPDGCAEGAMDAYPVPPAARDLWGLRAGKTHIAAFADGTTLTVYRADGTQNIHSADAGDLISLSARQTPDGHPVVYPAEPVHITADKPVSAVQTNRPWNKDTTPLLDRSYLARRYAVPVDAVSMTAVCPEPETTLVLHNGSGQTVTAVCGKENRPDSFCFNVANALGKISAGAFLEADKPVYLVFETLTLPSDERNLLGAAYKAEE